MLRNSVICSTGRSGADSWRVSVMARLPADASCLCATLRLSSSAASGTDVVRRWLEPAACAPACPNSNGRSPRIELRRLPGSEKLVDLPPLARTPWRARRVLLDRGGSVSNGLAYSRPGTPPKLNAG